MKRKLAIGIGMGLAILIFFLFNILRNNDPLEVKIEVNFPIKEYRGTDSRVPGFPLHITAEGADEIRVSVREGSLLLWNPPDYSVNNKGQEIEIKSGDQIYWSPLQIRWSAESDNNKDDYPDGSRITLIAYHNNKQAGTAIVEINADDSGVYTGKLIEQE